MSVHVVPVNDLREHTVEDFDCECDPTIEWIDPETELPYEDGPLVIHNSWDGRELLEVDAYLKD